MHRMGAQVHGLGANEPTCTPLATPLVALHNIVTVDVLKTYNNYGVCMPQPYNRPVYTLIVYTFRHVVLKTGV